MTEAQRLARIKVLKDLRKEYTLLARYNGGADYDRYCALDMAVESLEQEPCGDCVSRAEALEQMDCWLESGEYRYTNATWYLRNRIKDMSSVQPKAEWIPVSERERLPKEETDVLVCNTNGDIEISCGSYSTEIKGEFIWYTSGWKFGEVVAWMPLPKPYKAESEG